MADPGLPLTTGEGNTAAQLRAKLDALKSSETPVVDQVDVERWLFDHAENLLAEAECGRLRGQLEAARQALTYIAGYQSETQSDAEGVTLMQAAARAALGVGDG